jgi:lysophospholipase L1-like esterase
MNMNFYLFNKFWFQAAGGLCLCLFGGCSGLAGPDPNVRVIAFGDSTTAGPTDRNYWDILREKWGLPPETFAGQGEGGESSEEGLTRLNDLLTQGLYPNAQILLYWEGGDDLVKFARTLDPLLLFSPNDPEYPYTTQLNSKLGNVQANIEEAIQTGKKAGLTVSVTTYYFLEPNIPCKAMPLSVLLPEQADKANAYVIKLNERIRQAAKNQNALLVDVETIGDTLRQDPQNYYDCNHLSATGNELVAGLFQNAVPAPQP